MATAAIDFWGDEITVDVRTPLSILREQANLLEQKTRGILRAKVRTVETDDMLKHDMVISAPVLRYSVSILSVMHSKKFVYPASVLSKAIPKDSLENGEDEEPWQLASTEDAFSSLLRTILKSDHIKAILHSLIATSNETPNGDKKNEADNG